jgi:serine/threonine protein kinase
MGTGETYARKADIFSIGCVIFEILTLSKKLTLYFFSDLRQIWGERGLSSFGTHLLSSQLGGRPFLRGKILQSVPSFISRCLR